MAVLEYWNQFRAMAYSDELLIAVGALLLLIGIMKIVKSSLTMLFWVVLSGLGLTAISQGLDQSPFGLAERGKEDVTRYLSAGKEISADALAVLCRKLEESEMVITPQNEN